MPIQTTCPQCQSSYRLPDTQMGKRVRCKKCQSVFIAGEVVDAPVLQEASPDEIRQARGSKPDVAVEELPVFDEVITNAPRPTPTPPPPRRAFRDDGDPRRDDYDDEPYDDPPRAGGNLALILGAVGALILLLGGGLVGAYFFLSTAGPDLAGGQTEQSTGNTPLWPNDPNKDRRVIPRPVNQRPARPRDFDTALAYLQLNDAENRRLGLDYLLSARVDPDKRDRLDKAVEPLLDDPRHKKEAGKVVLRWGGKHQLRVLENQLKGAFEWKEAMDQLAKMDDDRAAELVAEQLGKTFREDEAAAALKRMGKRAERPAIKYLHHRRAGQHVRGLVKEWKTEDEVLAAQALEDLSARDRETKDAAAETLAGCKVVEKLQDKVAKALAEHMKEDWFGSRKKTAKALEVWATADSLDTVHAYLGDRDAEVRLSMFKAVIRLKDEKSIPFLVLRLGSEDKVAAAKVLVTYGTKAEKSVQVLLSSTKPEIRLVGVELLSVIGTADSVPLLNKLAKIDLKAKKACVDAVKVIEAREGMRKDGSK